MADGPDFRTLSLMLEHGWPMPVKRAYQDWVLLMDEVAKALAAGNGAQLSGRDRVAITARAFHLVMD